MPLSQRDEKLKTDRRRSRINTVDSAVEALPPLAADPLYAELKAKYEGMNGSKTTKKVKPRCSMPNLIKPRQPESPYMRKQMNPGF